MSKKLLLLLLFALLAPWAANAQNQLNEGFEGTAFPPDDWTAIHVSGNQAWTRSTGTGNNGSSAFALRKDVSGGYEDYLITPKLVPATGEELSFYLASQYAYSYSNTTLTIEVSTTTPEIASFTTVLATYTSGSSGNFGTTGASDWVNKTVDVSAYVGQQIYIAFHAKDTGYNADVRIDDVTGVSVFVPACPKPTELTVDATAELATLSWTSDADSWNLKYKAADDADYTEVTRLTTTSYEMSVTPQTTYQWMVQAVCDGTPGDYTNPASFTTPCAASDIPYTYDFEQAAPFDCWAVISGNVSVINNASNSHESSYYLDFRGSTSNMVALPGFNAATNTLRIEFWTRPESTSGSSGKFAVGYMTNLTDASTFVAVETYNSTEMTTTYVKKAVNLNSVPANAYIAFRQFDCQTYYYWFVDDVTVMEAPSCLAPTGLAANASTNSAELSWTANGSETAWTIYYKKTTDENYTEVSTANNPHTLNGLDAASNYQFYVVANCSGTETSEPSVVCSFATACDVIPALGYAENFDSYTGVTSGSINNLPLCWNFINTTTYNSYKGYPVVYNGSSYSHSGNNHLRFYTYAYYSGGTTSYDPQDQYAILPEMSGLAGKQITLWARGANDNSTFKIGTMRDPADASTFTLIATETPATSYREYIYLIPENCTDSYVAIMMEAANASATSRTVYIDDISIAEPPACPKPMSLAVVNNSVNGHGATLSWESEAEAWDVAYKKTADEEFTIITGVTVNPYAITGLAPETAYTVKVRANCGSGVYSDWSTTTSFTTAVACTAPTGLAATLTPGNGNVATLSWTSDANAWVIAYKTADETDFTEIAVTENPYTFDRLEAEATYTAKVKANCGDEDGESQWSSTITFTPTDSYLLTVNDGTTTNQYVPFYGWMADSGTDGLFIIPATSLTALQWGTINKLTFYVSSPSSNTFTNSSGTESEYAVYMKETDQTAFENTTISFEGMTLVKNSFHVTISDYKLEVTLDNPFEYMGGNLMIGFDETVSGGYSRTYWYGVEATGASIGGYGTSYSQQNFLPKTTFDYIPGEEPDCLKPTGLAVNYEGGLTATVTWNGEATSYNIEVNGTVTEGVTSPYTLDRLELATNYAVKVQANCGGDLSEWAGPVSFTTDLCLPENMCAITIELTDAYGDGGGQIQVVDNLTEEVLGTYTNSSASTTYTLNVCDGRVLNFIYTSTDSWSYENGWVITDINGEIISEHEGCSSSGSCDAPEPGIIATYTVNCTISTCKRPTDLATDAVLGHSVILNWTENGEATEWMVAYSTNGVDFREDRANAKPFTLGGLEPETEYTVKVRPVCDVDDKWSDAITFTTDVACAAPAIAVETTATTAIVTITGDAETYNLRYRTPRGFHYNFEQAEAWTITDFSPCSIYDGDQAQCYSFNGETFTNIPFTGSTIAFQSQSGNLSSHSGNAFGLMISAAPDNYPEGVTHSDDWFILPELTIAEGDVFQFWGREITTQYGDETINVGIYGDTEGTFAEVIASEVAVSSTTYELYSYDLSAYAGQTIRLAINYVSADIFGFMFDDIFVGNPADDTWDNTYNDVTSPYEITGLEPETDYEVQVQANCGDDGLSEWSVTFSFTTNPLCMVPTNLAVSDISTDKAAVSWESTATSFDIEVNGEVTEGVTSPYTLVNLEAGTLYTIRVRANCGTNGYSNWTSSYSFYTNCEVFDLPYEFGFNNDDIYCWTMESANSNNSFGVLNATNNNIETVDGDDYVFLFSSYNSASSYDQILISPELNAEEVMMVEFYYRTPNGYGSGETFKVGYSTDGIDFTWGDEISTTTTEWTRFAATYPAGTKYVAIHYYANYQYYLYVDGFKFSYFQTTDLAEGWNRFSTYIETEDPIEILDMLKASLGDNAEIIEAAYYSTFYESGEWFGDLDYEGLNNEEMYFILVNNACTVELTGKLANPANHPITIMPDEWNRIAYPYSKEVEVTVALSDFEAEEGDIIESIDGTSYYVGGGEWFGDFDYMIPGQGYMYYSAGTEPKTLVFNTGAKKARSAQPVVGTLMFKRQPVKAVTSVTNQIKSPTAKLEMKTK